MFQDTYIISLIIYPVKQQNVKTASIAMFCKHASVKVNETVDLGYD